MPVQFVGAARRLTMADVPEVWPVVLAASRPVPAWLGGEPVVLPQHMPCGLPQDVARRLAAMLAERQSPTSR